MLKVSDVTATADQNGEFTNGVVAQGLAPTIIDAQWLNAVQRELVNAVEGSGQVLDKTDFSQLAQALQVASVKRYPFNQAFSTAIGGYPKGAIILGSDAVTLWQSTIDSNTTDPDSAGASGWLTPLQAQIIDIVDAPLIGNLQFRASVAEGDGWLRLPEKATSANATLSRTQYGKLFAKIGTTFGAGDGSTTFGLPTILDSEGKFSCFLRPMLSSGTIGAKHGDTIRNITGNLGYLLREQQDNSDSGAFIRHNTYYNRAVRGGDGVNQGASFNAGLVVPTGPENTPKYAEYPIFIFAGRNPA